MVLCVGCAHLTHKGILDFSIQWSKLDIKYSEKAIQVCMLVYVYMVIFLMLS